MGTKKYNITGITVFILSIYTIINEEEKEWFLK